MKEKYKQNFLNFLGVILLLWGIAALVGNFLLRGPSQILWFCYIGLIVIGIGILIRSSRLIGSQVNILAIPLLIWDIDFVYRLIMGEPLFGITDYLFVGSLFSLPNLISMQHLFTIPLAIYAMYLIKVKEFDFWKISVIQVIVFYFLVLLFTPSEPNINCVYVNCLGFNLPWPYWISWFLAYFVTIGLTNFILSKLSFLRK